MEELGAVSPGQEDKKADPGWGLTKHFEEQDFVGHSIGWEGMV